MVSDVIGDQSKVGCVLLMVVLPLSCVTDMGPDNHKVIRVQWVVSRDQHTWLEYKRADTSNYQTTLNTLNYPHMYLLHDSWQCHAPHDTSPYILWLYSVQLWYQNAGQSTSGHYSIIIVVRQRSDKICDSSLPLWSMTSETVECMSGFSQSSAH